MKKLIDKLSTAPKWMQALGLAMITGASGAAIMRIFKYELNQVWSSVYFAILLAGATYLIYFRENDNTAK